MASLCWNCDFVIFFISLSMYSVYMYLCILLSAADGVIKDDDDYYYYYYCHYYTL